MFTHVFAVSTIFGNPRSSLCSSCHVVIFGDSPYWQKQPSAIRKRNAFPRNLSTFLRKDQKRLQEIYIFAHIYTIYAKMRQRDIEIVLRTAKASAMLAKIYKLYTSSLHKYSGTAVKLPSPI